MLALRVLLLVLLCSAPLRAQAQSAQSAPALHAAAMRGDEPQVTRLLDQGAAIDARNERGETALLLAVAAGHARAADLLIRRGAGINAQAHNKDSPWLLAGARGRTAMLEMMLPRKPDYTLLNRFGGTALIPACHYGHVETVRFLTQRSSIDIDHVNNLGWTCLLEAVILGDGGPAHQEIVRIVLASGAKPDIADKDGVTALVHARKRGQAAVAGIIAKAGVK